jgi:hypothetical protein
MSAHTPEEPPSSKPTLVRSRPLTPRGCNLRRRSTPEKSGLLSRSVPGGRYVSSELNYR